MEGSNPHNQGYWFVLREDQGNVIFSSNNITAIQNPHIPQEQEQPRYIIEAGNRSYPHVTEAPPAQENSESSTKAAERWQKTKDDNFWDRNKIKLLLTLCLENKNVEKDALWEEISSVIGATPDQCNMKYRHLRRTYLRLLKKKRLGKDIKWIHYNICEEVFTDLKALPPSVLEPWEDHKIRRLLNLYIEYLPRFRNPNCLQKDIWKEIASQIGTTGYNCYHKFKNLKRSYLNWLNRSSEVGKGIKWVYHQYFERIYHNYVPGARTWNRTKTKLLLDAYAQIAHKFRNPRIQKKELWNEISMKVGETPIACDKKFRNLKQTFVRLRLRATHGRPTTKWRYYRDFEAIYNNTPRYVDVEGYPIRQEENYVKHLLEFYLAHKEEFRDPLTKNKSLWKMIAPKLGMFPEECDKKFRNLKQTYVRLAWKRRQSGQEEFQNDKSGQQNSWPYFSYFEKIYDDIDIPKAGIDSATCGTKQAVPESHLGETLRELHEHRDSHRRFERLAHLAEECNQIQRERNQILQALLNRKR